MLKYVNLIILMALAIFAGCNNPSGGSSIAQNHTPGLQPPSAFAFTQIRSQNGDVSIRWSPSSRVDKYTLFMSTDNTNITTPVAGCTNYRLNFCQVSGLNPNTVYYFSVTSTNAAGSKIINNYGTALSVGSFDITSSATGDAYIDLTWTNSNNATSYNVIYGTRSGSYTSTRTGVTSPYRLTGLTNNVRHYVRVVAVNNQGGYGLSDTEISEQPFGPPAAPAGVAIAATPGQMVVSWNNAVGATSYKVFRGTSTGSYTQVGTTAGTTYTDTTTVDGTSYFYVIGSFNGYDSPYSAEVSAKSISNFNVTSLVSGPAANQITVTWPAATGADSYDIYYGTNSSSLTSVITGATSPRTLTGLTGNVPYYVRVLARNAVGSGTSNYSLNQLSAVPVPAIAPPIGLVATATPGQIQLSWTAVSGASSYEIFRGTSSGSYVSIASGVTTNNYTDTTGIANGTPYFYVVQSFNGLNSVNSAEVSKKPIANFSIVSISSPSPSSLVVNWGAAAGADAYDIHYRTGAGATQTLSGVTSGATVTGLSSATSYFVSIRGRNTQGGGTNLVTAESSFTTQPGPPSTLSLIPTPGQIRLNWSSAAGAGSYSVYRSATAGGPYTSIASGLGVLTYDDTTVTDGTTYYYVVTATSGGTESANSVERSARTIEDFSLTSVTVASSTSLVATWPVVAGAASYTVRYRIGTGAYTSITSATSPTTITGLTANTTYNVSVVATNAVGPGASVASPEVSAKTAPATPVIASLTGAPGQVTINYAPGVAGASYYKILRGTSAGALSEINGNHVPTSFTDNTGVVDGTQYYYAVVAYNGTDSAQSAVATLKTVANFAITSVTAPSTSTIEVTWPAVAGADSYDVKYRSTGATTTLTNRTSPFTITGLASGTTYYVSVVARNAIGSGTSFTSAEDSTVTPVGAPTGLTATATPGSVELDWGIVPAASSFKVYRGDSTGSYNQTWTGVTPNTYTDNTVVNGSVYYYAVKSFNGSDSAFSSEIQVKPIASFAVGSTTATATTITVNWSTPVAGADAFDIQYRTGAAAYTTLPNQTSGATITGLTAGTNYDVRLVGKNTIGAGTTFTTAVVTQKTALTGITDLAASQITASQIGLNWSAKAGATNYKVFRRIPPAAYDYNSPVNTTTSLGYIDTTGTDGTTYSYVVRAFNGSDSVDSNEVTKKQIGSFTFSSLAASSSTTLNLTWTAAAGADDYRIVYGVSSGSSTFSVNNISGTSYTLTALNPNQIYFVRVIAQNSTSATVTSSELNATTAPAAPTTLAAAASTTTAGRIALSWVAPAGAVSYKIYRSTTSNSYGAATYTGITGTSYTDTSISEGTQYYYKISAVSSAESPLSNEATAQAISNFATTSVVAQNTTTIDVTWPAVTGATSYDILYRSSGATTTLTNRTSPFSITGLSSGTTYYVIVRAKNAIGSGTQVDAPELSAVTPVGAPTPVTLTATPGSVKVDWGAVPAATSFKVFRGDSSGTYNQTWTGITPNTYTDSTVVNGSVYYYAVKSFNGSDSAFSSEVQVKPIASFAVGTTPATATTITVNWTTPVAGADSFDIQYRTGAGAWTTLSAQSPGASITGLISGTDYEVKIIGKNSVGAGTTFTTTAVTQKTALTGITDLTAAHTSALQIGLNWSAKAGATNYRVYRRIPPAAYDYNTPITTVAGLAYLDTGVSANTTYSYVVRSFNGTEAVDSNEVTKKAIGSFTFSSLVATSSTTLDLSWTAASGADNYKIVYGLSAGSSTFSIDNVVGTSYTLTALNPNQIYYVRIIAQNSTSATVTSSELNATTAPAAPTSLVATVTTTTSGRIALSWTGASGASTYKVYRSTTSNSYGAALQSGITGTNYTDTSISEGTQYYYKVSAVSSAESPLSNEVTGQAISNFSTTSLTAASTTSIQVTWPVVSGAVSYDVLYRSTGATTTLSSQTSPLTISSLSAGTTYYVIVRAKNAIGTGTQVDAAELNVVTPVAAPTALAATSPTGGQVNLSWTNAAGASSYKIYRSITSNSYGAALQTGVTSSPFIDTNAISNGTVYYYKMTSFNGSDSALSSEVSVKPIANFTISATATSDTSLNVTWGAIAGADSYDLEYGTASGTYSTTVSGVTSPRAITGLVAGTTYFLRIVAKNTVGTGTSRPSSELAAATAFGAPSGLAAVGKPTQNEISWSVVAGADYYNLYRKVGAGAYSLISSPVGTTYNDTSAVNGTTYVYMVRAFGNAIESPDSTTATVQSISNFTQNAATVNSATNATVSWGAATGAASYDVYLGTATGSYGAPVNVAGTTHTFTTLTANTNYFVRITAKNSVGAGTTVNSNEVTFLTSPAAISNLAIVSNAQGAATLSWSNPGGTNTYTIKRGATGGPYTTTVVSNHNSTSYTETGLTNGTTYFYVVYANNGTDSAVSNEDSIQPIANFSISSTSAPSTTSVTVNWGAAAGAANYEVWVGTSTGSYGGSAAATVGSGTLTSTISGLTAGTTYYIQVRATNNVGGVTTTRSTAEVTQITPLAAPSITSIAATPAQAVVNWSTVGGATSYRLYWGTSTGDTSGGFFDITAPTTSYTHTGRTNGQAYFYTVRSFNGAFSAYSLESSVKPIASFTVGTLTATDSTITVNWTTPVLGADTFDIQHSTGGGAWTTLATQSPGAVISGLTANTTYDIRLVGKNTQGVTTSLTTASVAKTTALGAPSGFALASTDGTVSASWTGNGATTYKLFRRISPAAYNYGSPVYNNSTTSTIDSPTADGTTYSYVVRANNGTDSVNSTELSVQPIGTTTLSTATAASANSVNLTWAAAAGAASYDVYYRLSSGAYGAVYSNVPGTSTTVSGLTANTNYTFKIVAKNTTGVTATRTSNELSALTSPTGITDLTIVSNAQAEATLSWTNPGGTNTYTIKRGTTLGGPYGTTVISNHNSTSYTNTGLVNGTTYYYVVIANNGTDSAPSNEDSIQPIANFSITSTSAPSPTSVTVNWGTAAGAATYEVWIGNSTGSYGGSAAATVASGTLTATITGLTAGSTYYIQVRAKNTVGGVTTSRSTAEATQVTPLGPPTISSLVAVPGQVTVNWGLISGATGYRILRGDSPGVYNQTFDVGTSPLNYADTTSITNGNVYYYAMQTFNGAYSSTSGEVQVKPIAAFTVGTLTATANTITVNWTNPAGGSTYDVEYRTGAAAYTTLTNFTNGGNITGLTAGTAYDVRIVAKNIQGTTTTTYTTASVSKTTALGAPTLSVVSDTGTAKLSWTNTGGSYKIFRATSSNGYTYVTPLTSPAAGVTSYEDSPGTGTQYYYVIRSFNGSDSVNSNEVSVTPIATVAIASATPTSATTVDLSWNIAGGASSYDVYYRLTSGSYGAVYVNTAATTATISGLSANTSYTFKVVAKNAAVTAATRTSNEPTALTPAGAPASFALHSNNLPGQASMTWAHNGSVSEYRIYRGTSAGSLTYLATVTGTTTAYLDGSATPPANGTTYFYAVRSFNGTESANSTVLSVEPISSFTLTATTTASDTSVNLTWTSSTGADTYDVYYDPNTPPVTFSVANAAGAGATTYTLTGLNAASLYYVKVRARSTAGQSSYYDSNIRSFTTATAPPTSVVAAVTGSAKIRLTWTNASGASNYNVWRASTSGGVYSQVGTAVASGWEDLSATNGSTWYYVVRSFNGSESANSGEVFAQAIASFSLTSVTGQSSSSLRVTWPSPAGGAIYDVLYRIGAGAYTTLANKTSPFDITGLAADTAYNVVVRAKNSVGPGASIDSNEVSGRTALAAPTGLAATGGIGQVSLTWNPSSATYFKVLRGTVSGTLTQIATNVNTNSYVDSTAANGTTYYYAVVAYNGSDSSPSSEVFKQPIALPVISSVVGNSTTSVQLTWTVPTGASSVNVLYGNSSGSYSTTITSATSPYDVTGLTAGTTYYFRIQGVNAVGGGTTVNSAESSGTPNSAPVISVIADQSVEANTVTPVAFNLSDANHVLTCTGSMSASSSNTTLLPNANIVFSGSMPNCTATLTPVTNQIDTTVVTLTANDGISTTSRTFNFTTNPCTVASIVWTTQPPANTSAGSAFGTVPRVTLKKADGTNCTTNFNPVSLDVSVDGSLQGDADVDVGTNTAVASGGIVTFTGTGMKRAGTAHQLAASVDGVTSADSTAFNINALTATKIIFDQQPLATPRSAVMIPNPVVRTVDIYDNYVSAGNVNIALSFTPGTNTEGAAFGGTTSKNTSGGVATFTNLSVNTSGSYQIRATPASTYAAIDSDPFDVLTVSPVNTVSVMDTLGGQLVHASGNNIYYRRAGSGIGTNFVDGTTINYYWEMVATNANTGGSATVDLTRGTATMASVTIPTNTTTPTFYRTAFTSATAGTSNNDMRFRMTGTNVTILSSRVVAVQTAASKTQTYVPLTTVPHSSATSYVTITNTSYQALPDQNNLVFNWDPADYDRVNTLQFDMNYQNVSGNVCGSLWNKTTNTRIGTTEICGTNTSERQVILAINAADMPTTPSQIEARFKTAGSGRVFRGGLMIRLVSINNLTNHRRASHGDTTLTASKDYLGNRNYSTAAQYGTGVLTSSIGCTVKANTAGSGTFVLRDHNTSNSGTTTSNVSASTIVFSNQSAFTTLANVISTTDTDRMYLNYTHTSGSFNVQHCMLTEKVAY